MIIVVFILDLVWSLIGFIVDLPKIANLPFYLWPIVLICPIYPLLLAFVWYRYIKKKSINQYLISFAALPSVIFGFLVIPFYLTAMYYQGFSWRDVGQIFWVLFYAIQGFYLFEKNRISYLALMLPALYLMIKLFLDIKYQTFGYLNVEEIDPNALLVIFICALFIIIFTVGLKLFRQHLDQSD